MTVEQDTGATSSGLSAELERMHRGGKIEMASRVPLTGQRELSLAYTPGVAEVCLAIQRAPRLVDDLTWRSNLVAVVTDGSAVLGLGDLGPAAAMPVMEGKAMLFKQLGGVNAVPVCLDCRDVDAIVETMARIAPSFGGINLEDISAPRCFEIERRLDARLDIPVFHDDQHGTAIVVLAALRNCATLSDRRLSDLKVVVSGAGAAGTAVTLMLLLAGVRDITVADSRGVLRSDRPGLSHEKRRLAAMTNPRRLSGAVEEALVGADVFVGVSGGRLAEDAVAAMAPGCFVFALANPTPEVDPVAAARHARVVATGRSDYPNQINNALAFPGIFAGALAVRATIISDGMKLAAAQALSDVIAGEIREAFVIPDVLDPRVAPAVSAAVRAQARLEGVARA